MKKILLTLFLHFPLFSFAQDLITLKNGTDIKSKVIEINLSEIKYKKFDNLNGPLFSIAKEDVLIIRYENGTKDIFGDDSKPSKINKDTIVKQVSKSKKSEYIEDDEFAPFDNQNRKKAITEYSKNNDNYTNDNNPTDLCFQAKSDANRYYDNYKGATTGTALTTLIVGSVFGLIPAIACSSTPPSDYNLNIPNEKLERNPKYYNCYKNEAKKIKSNKVWTTFGITTFINIVAIAIIISL
jgi:hypothetical protein